MPDRLSPKIEERIKALCRQISVAHNLDEEIQAELYAHMEDKLLGYLSGAEKLTEKEAFVLVQKHFGDPAVIKSLLLTVHRAEAGISLARNLAVILALTLFTGLARYCLLFVIRLGNLAVFGNAGMLLNGKEIFAYFCEGTLFLGVLVHWRKRISNGEKLWFQTINPISFVAVIAVLLCLDTLAPFLVFLDPEHLLNIPPSMLAEFQQGHAAYVESHYTNPYWLVQFILSPSRFALPGAVPYMLVSLGYLLFQCIVWLWWCDTPPRNRYLLSLTAGAWALYSFLITTFQPAPVFQWVQAGQLHSRVDWSRPVWDTQGWITDYLVLVALAI